MTLEALKNEPVIKTLDVTDTEMWLLRRLVEEKLEAQKEEAEFYRNLLRDGKFVENSTAMLDFAKKARVCVGHISNILRILRVKKNAGEGQDITYFIVAPDRFDDSLLRSSLVKDLQEYYTKESEKFPSYKTVSYLKDKYRSALTEQYKKMYSKTDVDGYVDNRFEQVVRFSNRAWLRILELVPVEVGVRVFEYDAWNVDYLPDESDIFGVTDEDRKMLKYIKEGEEGSTLTEKEARKPQTVLSNTLINVILITLETAEATQRDLTD